MHPTFREACIARGLLDDDREQFRALQEASEVETGARLRQLFSFLLFHHAPTNPKELYDKFKKCLMEDILYREQRVNPDIEVDLAEVENAALWDINGRLATYRNSLANYPPMEMPTHAPNLPNRLSMFQEELDYDREELRTFHDTHLPMLNEDQRNAFDAIVSSIHSSPEQVRYFILGLESSPSITFHSKASHPLDTDFFLPPLQDRLFFVDGPGGTGKTFLYKLLLAHVRMEGHIALCVASSGIAAQLMPGGRTAHSRFKLPLTILENSSCGYVVVIGHTVINNSAQTKNEQNSEF